MADFRCVLLLAYRSRLLVTVAIGMAAMLLIAWMGYQFSGRQPQTVALDLGISFIRVFVPVLGILQIQDFLAKEVERRLIFTSLTYPRSRNVFLLGRFLAVLFLTAATMVLFTVVLAILVKVLGSSFQQATPVNLGRLLALSTAFSLGDAMVVLAFATFLATLATVPNLVLLVSIAFMVTGRSLSGVIQLLYADETLVMAGEQYRASLEWLRYLLPDLGILDIRQAALYDQPGLFPDVLWPLAAMPLGYTMLLLLLACRKFQGRQFS